MWSEAQSDDAPKGSVEGFRELVTQRRYLGPLAFLAGMYGLWNLMAGAVLQIATLLLFAVVRIGLGIWSFFVPAITSAGFHTLAWILTGFATAGALLGLLFAPSNVGKSLDEIQQERDEDGSRFMREREQVGPGTTAR